MDLAEAHRLCFLAAQHLEEEMPGWIGVVMPEAPFGIDSNTTQFAITVRPYILRDWLVDACQSLIRMGFFHFVCFSGHLGPKQLTAIEEAGKLIRKGFPWRRFGNQAHFLFGQRPTLVSASSAFVSFKDVIRSPFWPDPEEHGGVRDTSIALAIMPEDVDPFYSSLPKLEQNPSRWSRNLSRRLGRASSYWGEPQLATAEKGEEELLKILDEVFPKLRRVWDGGNQNTHFRSWYSVLPSNKSFFKSWLLVIFIVLVLSAWIAIYSGQIDIN
jgi:creatinine amidohydrolase/Fe(II)-dependent formamide hydrolase-like protein